MNKSAEVYRIVSEIPKGNVMTYGQIGNIVGIHPRLVGQRLHANTDPDSIPCHRVVNSLGGVAEKYAFGGVEVQNQKLRKEGVEFIGNRVNLEKCLYKRNH